MSPQSVVELAPALLVMLLSGLALVLAWLSAAGGSFWWHRRGSSGSQQQQLQQQSLLDTRPIAVFVFENFSTERGGGGGGGGGNSAVAVAASSGAAVDILADDDDDDVDGEEADLLPDDVDEAGELGFDDHNDDTDADEQQFHRRGMQHPQRHRQHQQATLAAYDIDVLESDGELDAEMRDRVEEVLLEYTMVMEAKSEAELRNRRLKYFNCLIDGGGGGGGGSGAEAAAAASAASTSASPMRQPSVEEASARTAGGDEVAGDVGPGEGGGGGSVGSQLRLRLKYFNDDQRTVVASSAESIASFKRKHFQSELSRSLNVRLIHNGRELKEGPNLTLASYAIPAEATIHCLVTEAVAAASAAEPTTETSPGSPTTEDASNSHQGDIGCYMFPLFGGILALMWYCRVCYKAYFNCVSTLALGAVSLLMCAAIVASVRGGGGGSGNQIRVHRINLDAASTGGGDQQQQHGPDVLSAGTA